MNVQEVLNWLNDFSRSIMDNKAYLSELDTPIGDGDHGNNMFRGVTAMQQQLKEKQPATVADTFKVAAMALMSNVGGASGPLYGSAFIAMSKKANESEQLSELILAGAEGIQSRGKATFNEKTMVDIWFAVANALKAKQLTQATIDNAIIATKDLKATKGRASYLGDRSIGHLDPGTVSSGYLFTTMIHNLAGELV
ncbi:dihydroxyacetone kinase subunit DhaL [Orbus sturtevantii]|uniref:dihydroxyacetone kinase subunit DhaL n=1 Tax=Orbus sturtevantii TaxID=3074109 RepID=UPI00370D29B7